MRRTNAKTMLSLVTALAACSANGSVGEDYGGTGGGSVAGAGGGSPEGGMSVIDASHGGASIGPEAGCGYALIPTEREPGSLLMVVDRSASMNETPDGKSDPYPDGPTKWDYAGQVVSAVLDDLPDDVEMGLLLYPSSSDGCESDPSPQVGIGPLSVTRFAIKSAMSGGPWGNTPTDKALTAAYAHLQSIADGGNRGVVLITDGAWNCGAQDGSIYAMVEDAYANQGIRTFAVGIPGSAEGSLSHVALVGGGAKGPDCNGAEPDPWHPLQSPDCGNTLVSTQPCCHYVVDSSTYVADLTAALTEVASKFLTSCVFQVPKGDPGKFDPNLVNVYVDGTLLKQNAPDGWTYVGGGTDALEIHGTTCADLLSGAAEKVEIQLGCATVVY